MLSLRQEGRMRSCALEDEVRALEATVADLSHQLSRARSEQSKQARREGGMMVGMGALSAMMCEASAPIGSLIASDAATRAARMEGTRAMDELAARLGEHTPRPAAAFTLFLPQMLSRPLLSFPLLPTPPVHRPALYQSIHPPSPLSSRPPPAHTPPSPLPPSHSSLLLPSLTLLPPPSLPHIALAPTAFPPPSLCDTLSPPTVCSLHPPQTLHLLPHCCVISHSAASLTLSSSHSSEHRAHISPPPHPSPSPPSPAHYSHNLDV